MSDVKNFKGSCLCGEVLLEFNSSTSLPFLLCYCSICVKASGSGGFGCNIMADSVGVIKGKDLIKATIGKRKPNPKEELKRYFCGDCGTHLYIQSDMWPDHVYPYTGIFSGENDSKLPKPPKWATIMNGSKQQWVIDLDQKNIEENYDEYPKECHWIANFHKRYA